MVISNKIGIKAKSFQNCADFASNFSQRINWHASKFDKVRVISDWYDVNSLKGNTRSGQNKGFVPVHYKIRHQQNSSLRNKTLFGFNKNEERADKLSRP